MIRLEWKEVLSKEETKAIFYMINGKSNNFRFR